MSYAELQHVSQTVTVNPANSTVTEKFKGHVVWGHTLQTDPFHDICKVRRYMFVCVNYIPTNPVSFL